MTQQRLPVVLAGAVVVALAFGPAARADVIVLRGGGQVRGKVIADPARPERVQVVLEHGRTFLSLERQQVLRVIEEAGPLDGYVVRRASAPATAQGQFDLGTYCEQNHLPDLARLHFDNAVGIEPAFAPAHEKLGHVLVQGRWLAGDELRRAQGMVKYKGRWITPEEKERHAKDDADQAAQTSWTRRIRVWRDTLVSGPDDRRREAESQLMGVRDPLAIPALVKVLGPDNDAMRTLLAHVLGMIPGNAATTALARQLVLEEAADVRQAFLDEIKKRDDPVVGKTLVQSLRSNSPAVVNRAAWAIGELHLVSAVPSLIPALVTTRQRVEMAPSSLALGESPAITASFGTLPYMGGPGAPIAYNGSSIGYLTPPAVGPGVVAFGATSMPAWPLPAATTLIAPSYSSNGYGEFAVGGGMSGRARGPVPRSVTDTIENTEVRAALVRLTGQDHGYDQAAWRGWLRTEFKPEPVPARRVPQP